MRFKYASWMDCGWSGSKVLGSCCVSVCCCLSEEAACTEWMRKNNRVLVESASRARVDAHLATLIGLKEARRLSLSAAKFGTPTDSRINLICGWT